MLDSPRQPALAALGAFMLGVSCVLLTVFGAAALARRSRWWWCVPPVLAAAWIVGSWAAGGSSDQVAAMARYTLALPGASLASAVLALEAWGTAARSWPSVPRRALVMGALAFAVYGLAAGVVGPVGRDGPGMLVSDELFFESAGVPIQVVRTACAFVIAVSVVSALGVLRWEAECQREALLLELAQHRERLEELADIRSQALVEARAEVAAFSRLLPVCAWCRKIRDDHGYWQQIEAFMNERGETVTHSICPECARDRFGVTDAVPRGPGRGDAAAEG